MADTQLTIRLQPGRKNRVKLSQGNGNKPLFGVYVGPGDKITWTSKDQGNAPKISKWLVSFIQNQWSRKPPEPGMPGTPLVDASGAALWQVSGAGGATVDTWVANDLRSFQFAIAVLDEDGELYALDPEIRVRAPMAPIANKKPKKGGG